MKLDFKKITTELKKLWENKFDKVVISFILLLALAIALFSSLTVYQYLIKTDLAGEEQSIIPRRELKIKTELIDGVLKSLEERKKPPSLDTVEKTSNPFPEA